MSLQPQQHNQAYHQNFSYQPMNSQIPLGIKICKRSKGLVETPDFYCGRSLPLNWFSGRSRCKECSSNRTKHYNEAKIATIVTQASNPAIVVNHEMEESLSKVSLELEQMKIEYKKYYDGALEYHNENLKLKQELERLTLSNNDLVRKDKLLQSEIEDKTRTLKSNSDIIDSLQKENKELKSDIVTLNDEIRVLERKH